MIMFIFVETATYLNTLELLFYSVIIAVNDLGLDLSLCRNVTKGEGEESCCIQEKIIPSYAQLGENASLHQPEQVYCNPLI